MPLIKKPSSEEKKLGRFYHMTCFYVFHIYVAPFGGSHTAEHFLKSCGAPLTLN